MQKQRRRHEAHERRLTSDIVNSKSNSSDAPPGLDVVSDDESDDDTVEHDSSSRVDSDSGGEDGVWHRDHPILEAEPTPNIVPIPVEPLVNNEPEPTPNVASERATNRRSTRINNLPKPKYNLSLGAKQIPVPVRRASRKKTKYRQKMARRREEGDRMLNVSELDLPTVEDIMNCPLSKFIHFAANDCGYTGTSKDLIVNWIHPLFLKAKSAASKEDNPNWKQAMNGPFKEEYWKIACKEVETLESINA